MGCFGATLPSNPGTTRCQALRWTCGNFFVTESLPCIVCRKALKDAFPGPSQGNQPYPGLEFTTPGHYGSTIFDMEPGRLVVNICDDCITKASGDHLVRHRTLPPIGHKIARSVDTEWKSPHAGR